MIPFFKVFLVSETMTDKDEYDDPAAFPDTDPRHIDPAGNLAAMLESDEIDASLADDTDRGELEEFIKRAESGEFDADPGLEAAVRIARALLENDD